MAGSFVAVRGKPRSSPKRSGGGGGADPPLSLAMPTVADLHKTAELEKVIYLSTVSN
jgi:poly(A) polymerase